MAYLISSPNNATLNSFPTRSTMRGGIRFHNTFGNEKLDIHRSIFFGVPLKLATTGSLRKWQNITSARSRSSDDGDFVSLKILVPAQVNFGDSLAVSGSSEWLGKWSSPLEMQWSEEGWSIELDAERGSRVELKFLIIESEGRKQTWEDGTNRKWKIPQEGGPLSIVSKWNSTGESPNFNGKGLEGKSKPTEEQGSGQTQGDVKATRVANGNEMTEFSKSWKGKDTEFMSSNEHKKERKAVWNTVGLIGAALKIVEGDRSAGNWWRKLDVVNNLISNSSAEEKLESLIYSSIYLQWINTGQILCVEDGGHRRPNQHAGISRQIFMQLERNVGAKAVSQVENLVARSIHPRLPSFTAEFTASVPLTRIRDIAHRNDIPHDLKQEIKHTIQNKLHRNAGPEDLIATELLLARVTKSRENYSSAFIEQLEIFFGELKDFFNASSLTDQLDALKPSLDEPALHMLSTFLEAKGKVDAQSQQSPGQHNGYHSQVLVSALHAGTGLRAMLSHRLESGLRNDASDDSIAMRQKWRLSEIGLESYSFVLLSMFVNDVEGQGGAAWLAAELEPGKEGRERWSHCLGALVLGLRQVALSGWMPTECWAVEEELDSWQKQGNMPAKGSAEYETSLKEWALRLKASIERVRRLAEAYSQAIISIYATPSTVLGRALAIPDNTVKTYVEAEIRSNVVFQLSKLCSLLLHALRQVAQAQGFDVIMSGTAVGTLISVDKIDPSSLPPAAYNGPVILLVKSADGDEEVQLPGCNLRGIVLCQDIPHLSHLGVRARQDGVVFVTCEDELLQNDIRGRLGQTVRMDAYPDRVSILPSAALTESDPKSTKALPALAATAPVKLSPPGTVLPLADAELETSGSKAATCGELAVLSVASRLGETSDGGEEPLRSFRAVPGVVLPFGTMEFAITDSGSHSEFAALLEASETAALEGGQLDAVCQQLRDIVGRQKLPDACLAAITASGTFQEAAPLIVRSSSNLEDLPESSGAGLYDSIANVFLSNPGSFQEAVAGVWSSLYSRRAVLSRRSNGVKQSQARMAVLVQSLIAPQFSFVLHTKNPVDPADVDTVQAELAIGLGETLASGARGTPWRLSVSRSTKKVTTLAFANFGEALLAGPEGAGQLRSQVARYAKCQLSIDREYREKVGRKLAAIGEFLEAELGGPQDIEGCIVGEEVFVVQSRPQV